MTISNSISWLVLTAALLLFGIAFGGCKKVADMKKAAEQASKALESAQNATNSKEAGQKMGSAFEKLREAVGGGKAVQAVDFRRLKEVLPPSVPGMTREDVRGEQGSQMGFSTSKAEAIYTAEGERQQRLTVSVTDLGSMRGIGMLKDELASWGHTESESTRGYERSTTIRGYDGMEKFQSYEHGGSRGSLAFQVAGRFEVSVEGRNVPMETLKSAAEGIDVGALEAMKDAGVGVEDEASKRVAEMYEEYHRAARKGEGAGSSASAGGTPEQQAPRPQVVAASELKALLPMQAAGLPRTNAEHQSQALSDAMTIAQAEARYEDGDRRLSVHLTDYVEATAARGVLPGAAWMLFDVHRESDTGYEKTTTIAGHPAKETLRRRGSSTRCELEMVVGKRFLLTVDATNVPMEDVKAVLDQIGLDRLEELGRPAA